MSRCESAYENQRYARTPSGERQWRATTSLSPEPPPWSDLSGTRGIEHDIMPAPAGCHWTGNWSIDYGGDKDRMGFEYATKFERFAASARTNRGSQKWSDKYRRRLWVRPYMPNESGSGDGGDVGGAATASHSGASAGPGSGSSDNAAAQARDRSPGGAAAAASTKSTDSIGAQHPDTAAAAAASSSSGSGSGAAATPAGRSATDSALPNMSRQQIVDGMSAVQSHLGVLEAHARLIGGPRDSRALRQQLQVARSALRSRLRAAVTTITQLQEAQGNGNGNGNGDSRGGGGGGGDGGGGDGAHNESTSFSRAEWNKLRREMDKLQQRFERCDREARVMERQFPDPPADGADGDGSTDETRHASSDNGTGGARRSSKGGPGRLQSMRSASLKDLGSLGTVKRSDATGLRDAPEGSVGSLAREPPAAPAGQTWSAATAAAEATADARACAGTSGNDIARGAFVPRDAAGELLLAQMRPESHVQVNAHLIEERGTAIEEVASSIREVNALFKDMATHVSDQQEDIDKLEEQMMSANLLVREGVTQIEIAHDRQPECTVM